MFHKHNALQAAQVQLSATQSPHLAAKLQLALHPVPPRLLIPQQRCRCAGLALHWGGLLGSSLCLALGIVALPVQVNHVLRSQADTSWEGRLWYQQAECSRRS